MYNRNGSAFTRIFGFALIIPFASPAHGAQLISHWNLDEQAGSTVAADNGPGGHNGTLSGGATFVPGQGISGGALSMSENTASYVNMGNVLGIAEFPSGSFSIAAWVRSNAPPAGNQALVSKADFQALSGFVLGFNPVGGGTPGAGVFAVVGAAPGGVTSTTPVNDNQWHLVVGTYSPPPGVSVIYVDDGPAESSTSSIVYTDNSVNFLLGGVNVNSQPVAYFTGLIDEVQIYDGALTQQEVEQLYSIEQIFADGFD